jgi:hypothetical protein
MINFNAVFYSLAIITSSTLERKLKNLGVQWRWGEFVFAVKNTLAYYSHVK